MNRSRDWQAHLLPELSAPQHERAARHAPRPLPLFLQMVRDLAEREPETARASLMGLAAYELAPRERERRQGSLVEQVGAAAGLRDCGGDGPPAILIPSLINPPHILDLDREVSLASAVARMGRRALMLDWGPAAERAELDVAGHVEHLLVPLIEQAGRGASLVGYCLGGTMAVAAANLTRVDSVATLAAPWRFSAYPNESREALLSLWRQAQSAASALNALPMEVLQAAFWSLDPARTVKKFARLAELDPDSPEAQRFVTLEDWANEGEPLPLRAARELIEDMFRADLPGTGSWRVAGKPMEGRLAVPVLHFTASRDRITPAATAPPGEAVRIHAGHVGMVVGSARGELHQALAGFLDPACRPTT